MGAVALIGISILVFTMVAGLAPRLLGARLSQQQLSDATAIASGLLLASALLVVIPEGFHVAAEGGHDDVHLVAGEHADEHGDEHADEHGDEHADEHGDEHADEEAHKDETAAGVALADHDEDGHSEDEHDEHGDEGHEEDVFIFSPLILGTTIMVGFLFMLMLEGFGVGHAVHEEHHDHVEGHGHGHVHHPTSPGVLALGLSVHAVADGLAIGAAAAIGETSFSILVALAVLLHRAPAAVSLGLFTMHEGDGTPAARSSQFRAIAMFALATPIALVISYLLLDGADNRILVLSLLFSAGTFVYVATVDTLPAIHNPETGRRSGLLVLVGALVVTALLFGLGTQGLLEHGH